MKITFVVDDKHTYVFRATNKNELEDNLIWCAQDLSRDGILDEILEAAICGMRLAALEQAKVKGW